MSRVSYTTIASGDKVSGNVDLRGGELAAIYVPTVISGDLYVQGGIDATSGNFGRIFTDVGTPVVFKTGPGSAMALWPRNYRTPAYARFESSVTQTSPATLTILRS